MSWTLIEHQALSSSAASVTLGSGGTIPQTYKTLVLLVSVRQDSVSLGNQFQVKPNNTSSGYSNRIVYGSGSATGSGAASLAESGFPSGSGDTANTFGSTAITFPNYSGSTNKPWSSDTAYENNGTTAYQGLFANLLSNTAAITSLVITPYSGNWVSGCTFTLYGLA